MFCSIVKREHKVPMIKETSNFMVFLDVRPVSEGHCLIVPKHHAEKLHELPRECSSELGPLLVEISRCIGASDYHVLQTNGTKANQGIPHVHFHIIPKKSENEGIEIVLPDVVDYQNLNHQNLTRVAELIRQKLFQMQF
uniref:HIT domain-containing protein n=1 Tax=Arcella intermedia TaxID=1963864 RepID=A0A6B2LQG6_9EUKA